MRRTDTALAVGGIAHSTGYFLKIIAKVFSLYRSSVYIMDKSEKERKLTEAEYSTRKALNVIADVPEDSFQTAKAAEHLEYAAERLRYIEENL